MLSPAEYSNENLNYYRMNTIITDIVSDVLRRTFIREWDSRYQATVGAWDNTHVSGQIFFNREKRTSSVKKYLTDFQDGNTNQWDCTVLFNAILYSSSIGKARLNPTVRKEVDKLRKVRNNFVGHMPRSQLTDAEFLNASKQVCSSFMALGLSTEKIDKIRNQKTFQTKELQTANVTKYVLTFFLLIISILSSIFIFMPNETKSVTSFRVLPSLPSHEVIQRMDKVSATIETLKKLNDSSSGKLTYLYISGNPGSGKSQLARQIGECYHKKMQTPSALTFVMTLLANSPKTLLESYVDFARRLKCPENIMANIMNFTKATEGKIRHLRTQIATRIKSYTSWLLIVDDVENLTFVSPLLPPLGDEAWNGGQVLITTQETSYIASNYSLTANVIVSEGMDESESCHLLATISGAGDYHSYYKLHEVAKRLDYQPLALAAAAVYFKQIRETKVSSNFSWNNYLQKLREGKRQLTEERLSEVNPTYPLTMTIAVLLAVEKAAEADVVLNHIFHFLGLVSHESLPLEVAIDYVLEMDKNQDKEQVGVRIRKCSLILPDDSKVASIRLHRVVHEAVKIYTEKSKAEKISRNFHVAIKSFYKFKCISNDKRTWITHLKALHAVSKHRGFISQESTDSEIQEIFSYFGSVLSEHEEYILSESFYTTALNIIRKRHSNPKSKDSDRYFNKDISKIYHDLGLVYLNMRDLHKAKEYLERALSIFLPENGPNHIFVAKTYNSLGILYVDLGDLKQAKNYHKQASDIFIKQRGLNHVDVITSYNNLGKVHYHLGDLQLSRNYWERAFNILMNRHEIGAEYVHFAPLLNNLGVMYTHLRHLQQAKLYLELAVNIRVKYLGFKLGDVADSYNNLGIVHRYLGNHQVAVQYYRRSLKILVKQEKVKQNSIASVWKNLGNAFYSLGEVEQAERCHHQHDIYVQNSGPIRYSEPCLR